MKENHYTVVLNERDLCDVRYAACMIPSLCEKFSNIAGKGDCLNNWRGMYVRPPMRFSMEGTGTYCAETVHMFSFGELMELAVEGLSTQQLGGLIAWLAGRIAARGEKNHGKEEGNDVGD